VIVPFHFAGLAVGTADIDEKATLDHLVSSSSLGVVSIGNYRQLANLYGTENRERIFVQIQPSPSTRSGGASKPSPVKAGPVRRVRP
jgi:hypothetical protein